MLLIKALKGFCSGIDNLNEWMRRIFSWLIVPLTLIVVYDVIMRYVFNRPTVWAWDLNVQLLGALIALGSGYCLLTNSHIGVDVIPERLSPRKRQVLELFTYVIFIFSVGVLLWQTTLAAWTSVQRREMFNSYWMPPIYPLKIAMFVGTLLLWLQGIAKFLRNVLSITSPVRGGRP